MTHEEKLRQVAESITNGIFGPCVIQIEGFSDGMNRMSVMKRSYFSDAMEYELRRHFPPPGPARVCGCVTPITPGHVPATNWHIVGKDLAARWKCGDCLGTGIIGGVPATPTPAPAVDIFSQPPAVPIPSNRLRFQTLERNIENHRERICALESRSMIPTLEAVNRYIGSKIAKHLAEKSPTLTTEEMAARIADKQMPEIRFGETPPATADANAELLTAAKQIYRTRNDSATQRFWDNLRDKIAAAEKAQGKGA